jgi:hypothetical protein
MSTDLLEIARYRYDFPRPVSAALKVSLAGGTSYTVHATTPRGIELVDAGTGGIDMMRQHVLDEAYGDRAAVWIEDQDGLIVLGLDPRGNRLEGAVSNLESIREWHRNAVQVSQ